MESGHEKRKQGMQLWEKERKIYHPASRERGADLIHGVWTQGLGGSSALEPIQYYLPHYIGTIEAVQGKVECVAFELIQKILKTKAKR